MIEVERLRKRYGSKVAVDDLSFTVKPGRVTGFLGPNGAGKSTTMRMILGLDHPSGGAVSINGREYGRRRRPLFEIGALLDAKAVHGGRSAHNHLLCLAQSNGIGRRRVDEVVDLVGLGSVAGKRVKGFSLGMSQRLGIAAALLGDPGILMFDEPVNGLDPEGIAWIRTFMKSMAAQGRTVFVSSHLMSEMAVTADHLVVIGRGRLVADASIDDVISGSTQKSVLVRSPRADQLSSLLGVHGAKVATTPDGALTVSGLDAAVIGDAAAEAGIALHELTPQRASLEEAYMALTQDSVEYAATAAGSGATSGSAAGSRATGTDALWAAPGTTGAAAPEQPRPGRAPIDDPWAKGPTS
ncbi:MAG: ATP-binding cassette domain-containing protein [Frankia sp.]